MFYTKHFNWSTQKKNVTTLTENSAQHRIILNFSSFQLFRQNYFFLGSTHKLFFFTHFTQFNTEVFSFLHIQKTTFQSIPQSLNHTGKTKNMFLFFRFFTLFQQRFCSLEKKPYIFLTWFHTRKKEKSNRLIFVFSCQKKKKLKSEVKLFPHGSKYIKIYKYIFWSGILFSKSKYFLANSSVLRQN